MAWGLLPVYWKALGTVPPMEILCHRVVWSAGFLWLVTLVLGGWTEVRRALASPRLRGALFLGSLLIGGNWFLYIWAVNAERVLETSLGYYMNPLVNVLLGRAFFGERLRRGQLLAVALAAAGVLNLTLGYGRFPWIAVVLAVSFAAYGAVRKAARVAAVSGLLLETTALLPPALGYLVWVGSTGAGAFGTAGFGVTALLVGAGLATSLPLLGFAHGVGRLRLTTVGVLQFIAPTIAFCLGVFRYGEPFTRAHLVTFACIWTGVAVFALEGVATARRRPLAATP